MSVKIGTPLSQTAKKVLLCGAGELGKEVAALYECNSLVITRIPCHFMNLLL